jgi:hypothetical protein
VFGRRHNDGGGAAAATIEGLRDMVLHTPPAELGFAATPEHPHVYGVLMEMGYPTATATLACLVDGSTSLYFSSGGGIIGGGEHPQVAALSKQVVGGAEHFLDALEATTEFPLPEPGRVRFQVLTFDGAWTGEAGDEELGAGGARLSPLFFAGHRVIAALRTLQQGQA